MSLYPMPIYPRCYGISSTIALDPTQLCRQPIVFEKLLLESFHGSVILVISNQLSIYGINQAQKLTARKFLSTKKKTKKFFWITDPQSEIRALVQSMFRGIRACRINKSSHHAHWLKINKNLRVLPRSRWSDRSDPCSEYLRAHTCSLKLHEQWSGSWLIRGHFDVGRSDQRQFRAHTILIRDNFERTLVWSGEILNAR